MRLDSLLDSPLARAALFPVLLPASGLYAAGVMLDRCRRGRTARRLGCPTISIGNLTVGGTGKTPVLIRLVSDLLSMGRHPAILTRGYAGVGKTSGSGIALGWEEAASLSDEARMMADTFPTVPVAAGADRAAMADDVAKKWSAIDAFVLDDGFQHWSLHRDLDIVCIDATDPWGGGFLLPLGRLREPSSALRRARMVVITRCELVDEATIEGVTAQVEVQSRHAMVVKTSFETALVDPGTGAPDVKSGGPAIALSAIGNPRAFETGLERRGYTVEAARFADHHALDEGDLERVERRAKELGAVVVTTEKDWAKLRGTRWSDPAKRPPLRIARQKLVFAGDDEHSWRGRIAEALEAAR
ncbi:MAG: tetraacyldisaccharide 4'-kinase [Elusimicrobia bacterium]|nr:tetraacyldisaccharide 4'-kinase [Elusimicrobiota bacterium]